MDAQEPEGAEAKLREWGVCLGADIEADYFTEAMQELVISVIKGRLDFNSETKAFTYRLRVPIGTREHVIVSENKAYLPGRGGQGAALAYVLARYTDLTAEEFKGLRVRDAYKIDALVEIFARMTRAEANHLPRRLRRR